MSLKLTSIHEMEDEEDSTQDYVKKSGLTAQLDNENSAIFAERASKIKTIVEAPTN